MTSNRSEMIDRAFESRIHLILNYPDLTPESKEHIWRQLARRSGIEVTLTDDDFARLKELPMNGRQIKNAIKNAIMLANRHKKELNVGYIKTVLAATQSVNVSGI
jgi:SpoVK/Ycf46/Vps4 family AAA+-type ATPase